MLSGLFSFFKAGCRNIFNRRARLKDPALDLFLDRCENDPFAGFMRTTLCTPTDAFPDTIELTSENASVLARVFSDRQNVYDLAAYEAVSPGLGRRVWDMIEAERQHQEWLAQHPTLKEDAARHGYKLR